MFKRDVRLAENTLNKQDEIISQMKVIGCFFRFLFEHETIFHLCRNSKQELGTSIKDFKIDQLKTTNASKASRCSFTFFAPAFPAPLTKTPLLSL